MRILLIEDDIKIASFIVKGLKAAGFAVDSAVDGEEGLELALTEPYDTAIVDLMLPKRNGLSLIKEMRAEKVNTPILILSAKGSVDDRVKGLEIGAQPGKGDSPRPWRRHPCGKPVKQRECLYRDPSRFKRIS
jgi:two-component system OmpR family response regulator